MKRIEDAQLTTEALLAALKADDLEGAMLVWVGIPEGERLPAVLYLATMLQRTRDALSRLVAEVEGGGSG